MLAQSSKCSPGGLCMMTSQSTRHHTIQHSLIYISEMTKHPTLYALYSGHTTALAKSSEILSTLLKKLCC